jgi:hypothetical protein
LYEFDGAFWVLMKGKMYAWSEFKAHIDTKQPGHVHLITLGIAESDLGDVKLGAFVFSIGDRRIL